MYSCERGGEEEHWEVVLRKHWAKRNQSCGETSGAVHKSGGELYPIAAPLAASRKDKYKELVAASSLGLGRKLRQAGASMKGSRRTPTQPGTI
jgi:hypothetical protein